MFFFERKCCWSHPSASSPLFWRKPGEDQSTCHVTLRARTTCRVSRPGAWEQFAFYMRTRTFTSTRTVVENNSHGHTHTLACLNTHTRARALENNRRENTMHRRTNTSTHTQSKDTHTHAHTDCLHRGAVPTWPSQGGSAKPRPAATRAVNYLGTWRLLIEKKNSAKWLGPELTLK